MFQSKNLSVLSYANGFTLWHFRTSDPIDEILTPNYFGPAAHMIEPGDMILANVADGGAQLLVTGVEKAVVDGTLRAELGMVTVAEMVAVVAAVVGSTASYAELKAAGGAR